MAGGDRPAALVSGASRGIGKEIARQLARDHGFHVLAGARDASVVETADNVTPVQLDVSDQAGVDAALERIESDRGRLDVLVNNAGVFGPAEGVAEIDLAEIGRVFEVNTIGPIRLAQAFLPLLRRSDHPRIVNVSSGAGQLSDMDGGRTAYRVSKAGLNAGHADHRDRRGRFRPAGQLAVPGLGAHRHGRAQCDAVGRGGRRHRRLARDAARRRPHRRLLQGPQADSLIALTAWRRPPS